MMRPHTIVGSLHRRLGKFQRCKKTFSTASTRCASRPTEMRNAGSHDNLLTERATTGRREMPNQPARTLETYTRQRTGYYVHEAWKDTAAAHAAMAGRKCTRLLSRIETACLAGSACRGPVETIPVTEPKPGEILEIENGMLGRAALIRQARATREAIEKHRPDRRCINSIFSSSVASSAWGSVHKNSKKRAPEPGRLMATV
jgi:hypothetical protein